MIDLITHANQPRMRSEAPLAARMRPRTLDEFVCQQDILGPGKTSLAMAIVYLTKSH